MRVFDYTLTSSTGNTTTTCYAKFSEDKDWYSYTQKSGTGHNEGWNWSFSAKNGLGHQTLSKNTFESSGMTGVIHHYNAILLHAQVVQIDLATQIWAGADENYSSSYVMKQLGQKSASTPESSTRPRHLLVNIQSYAKSAHIFI